MPAPDPAWTLWNFEQNGMPARAAGPQRTLISRFLDTNGDGTGTKNANVAGQQVYKIQPPAGQVFRIARLLVSVEDTAGFTAAEYGNLGSALNNGVGLRVQNNSGTLLDLMDGLTVKTNAQWAIYCHDVQLKSWGATPDDELLTVRWTFSRSGQMIRLVGDDNQRLEATTNDNLAGLIEHRFVVQGYIE